MNVTHNLQHTKWNCKYHVVFAPKYRRKAFYGEKRREVDNPQDMERIVADVKALPEID